MLHLAHTTANYKGANNNNKHERLYDMLALSWRQYSYEGFSINQKPIRCVETTNDSRGTGLIVWDGAFVLGKFLEKRFGGEGLRDKIVLELGCGIGLAGLCAAALDAKSVYLTDLEYALGNTRENVMLNEFAKQTTCIELDWFNPDLSFMDTAKPDYVLLADVAWVRELVPPLVQTCHRILEYCNPQRPVFFLAHQTRSLKTDKDLFDGFRSIGLKIRPMNSAEIAEGYDGVPLYEIT